MTANRAGTKLPPRSPGSPTANATALPKPLVGTQAAVRGAVSDATGI